MDDQTNDFGYNFRRAVSRKGCRPLDLINLTGASPQSVSNWRKRGVSVQYAETVAAYLGVKPELISQGMGTEPVLASVGPVRIKAREPAPEQQPDRDTGNVEEPLLPYSDPRMTAKQFRLARFMEVLERADLSPRDLDLIEQLIERIAYRR